VSGKKAEKSSHPSSELDRSGFQKVLPSQIREEHEIHEMYTDLPVIFFHSGICNAVLCPDHVL
jgi:hypothetical protein